MKLVSMLLLIAPAVAQTWVVQTSGTPASLRGISAVDAKLAWASGSGGTYLKTADGGATWKSAKVSGADDLDFRDVQAFPGQTAYLLSAGPGNKSRIYKTADGGARWTLQFTNPDPNGFFDAMAFWDARRGILVGDPVEGHFAVFTTSDGGDHWQRRPTPDAMAQEGAFAASGTCLVSAGTREAWFATGGPQGSRVFHTRDGAASWTVAATPIRNDGPAAGIFSLAFSGPRRAVAVGGDYTKPEDALRNVAITADGGQSWTEPAGAHPGGFRSAVAYLRDRKMWIAVGTSGSDVSTDGGKTWKQFDSAAYNAIGFVSSLAGWAVGPRGRIARFQP